MWCVEIPSVTEDDAERFVTHVLFFLILVEATALPVECLLVSKIILS